MYLFQMVRNYKRKTKKGSWSQECINAAIQSIKNGRSIRDAARIHNIPRTTLMVLMKRQPNSLSNLGRKSTFTKEEEAQLCEEIKQLSKRFYGISRQEVKRCAYEFAVRNTRQTMFSSERKTAGDDWLYGFLRRNPSLSLRKPEATSISRITAFNRTEVSIFYENLQVVQDKYSILPSHLFNCDETGISTVQTPGRILAPKGQKQVGFATSWERGRTITVMCAMSAGGSYIPPMFIYARKRMCPELQRGGPPGSIYCCSDKGWITDELFLEWLKHFQKHTKCSVEGKVMLVLDNHVTHSTLAAFNFCKENGIVCVSIPPHSSHKLQPLDVTFYSPLKTTFNAECCKFLRNNPHEQIRPSDIASLFANAYNRVATPEKAIKGFLVTGIHPLNPDIFTEEDFVGADLDLPPNQQEVLQQHLGDEAEAPRGEVSFAEILSPASRVNKQTNSKKSRPRMKQHSEILTATPNKEKLVEKERKRNEKRNKEMGKEGRVKRSVLSSPPRPEPSTKRSCKKTYEHSSDSETDTEVEYFQPSDDDQDITEDICLVCGEFGKDKELWLKCLVCGKWAHSLCTESQSKKRYICDFCS